MLIELINLEAILNLPKGTELYISDIHGEFSAFDYILRTCAGNLKEKISDCFTTSLTESQINSLTLLIAYPEKIETNPQLFDFQQLTWQEQTIKQLLKLISFVSSKYTRSKVRKKLPKEYCYIIEELIYTDTHFADKAHYRQNMIDYLLQLKEGMPFIKALAQSIRTLVIDHIHIVGDIFDRGPETEKIMDALINLPAVDIQWGNHDILWMGAFFGSEACLLNLLRIATRYQYLYEIEAAYGINLRPLFLFAEKTYQDNPAFQPKESKASVYRLQSEKEILVRVHQALAIIQFKIEQQLIKRRPEFQMQNQNYLQQIDYSDQTIWLEGKQYELTHTCFQTIDPKNPLALTGEERFVLDSLMQSFQNSPKMKKHIDFLLQKGSMYLIYNQQLLYHGCMPLAKSGEFLAFHVHDCSYRGKELFDFFEYHIRKSSQNIQSREDFSTDLIWYCWCGAFSPLFGKKKMTTFERYFIQDNTTHYEEKNAYYTYRNSAKICEMILEEFQLSPLKSRIINGHTPVKTLKGESPIRGEGLLFVIDGGLSKAYQKQTGIAGYSLLNNSYGFQLVTHQAFPGADQLLATGEIITSVKRVIDQVNDRTLIKETTIGEQILAQKQALITQLNLFTE